MINERFYGYKHWTLEEVPRCFYVGRGLKGRPEQQRNRNHKWYAIVERHGLRIEICTDPITHEAACIWEVDWIAKERTFSANHSHDSSDIGCNFTIGGDGVIGRKHNEETKKKISLSSKGRKISDEARANLRKARSKVSVIQFDLSGNVVATYISQSEAFRSTGISGISLCCRRGAKSAGGFVWRREGDRFDPKTPAVLSEEHRQKLSQRHLGMKHTDETRKKIGDAQRGRLLSVKHKQNIGHGVSARHKEKHGTSA